MSKDFCRGDCKQKASTFCADLSSDFTHMVAADFSQLSLSLWSSSDSCFGLFPFCTSFFFFPAPPLPTPQTPTGPSLSFQPLFAPNTCSPDVICLSSEGDSRLHTYRSGKICDGLPSPGSIMSQSLLLFCIDSLPPPRPPPPSHVGTMSANSLGPFASQIQLESEQHLKNSSTHLMWQGR